MYEELSTVTYRYCDTKIIVHTGLVKYRHCDTKGMVHNGLVTYQTLWQLEYVTRWADPDPGLGTQPRESRIHRECVCVCVCVRACVCADAVCRCVPMCVSVCVPG